MKRVTALFLIIVMLIGLCACGSELHGSYTNGSGYYTVEFSKNGTCTWYQDGMFFNGTYEKAGSGWRLKINGQGLYENTVFTAERDGKALVITGGVLYNES